MNKQTKDKILRIIEKAGADLAWTDEGNPFIIIHDHKQLDKFNYWLNYRKPAFRSWRIVYEIGQLLKPQFGGAFADMRLGVLREGDTIHTDYLLYMISQDWKRLDPFLTSQLKRRVWKVYAACNDIYNDEELKEFWGAWGEEIPPEMKDGKFVLGYWVQDKEKTQELVEAEVKALVPDIMNHLMSKVYIACMPHGDQVRFPDARPPYQVPDGLDSIENYEWDFADSAEACLNCNKVILTQPSHYGWQPDFWEVSEGKYCQQCVASDFSEEYMESRINNPDKCINAYLIDPEDFGYASLEMDFATGLHPGQNDSPSAIAEALSAADIDYVFTASPSQFTTEFTVWVEKEDLAKAVFILETSNTRLPYSPSDELKKVLAGGTSAHLDMRIYTGEEIKELIAGGKPDEQNTD